MVIDQIEILRRFLPLFHTKNVFFVPISYSTGFKKGVKKPLNFEMGGSGSDHVDN